jgi:hypothetical protein
MFSPTDRSAIRNIVIAALTTNEDLQAFSVMHIQEQIAKITELVTAAGKTFDAKIITAFAIFGRLRSGSLIAGSPDHLALRDTLSAPKGAWHKPNAPTSAFGFIGTGWDDEFKAVALIAEKVSFADVSDAAYDELVAAHIRGQFGLGGLEDFGDPRAIGINDPTMKVLIEGVKVSVRVQHGNWFDGSVVTEGRSIAEIKAEAEAAEKARKLKDASDRRAKRVEELRKAYAVTKAGAIDILHTNGAAASPVILAAQELEFEAFFAAFNEDVDLANLDPAFEQLARLLPSTDFTKVAAEDLEEATKQDKLDRIALVVQFLFTKVNAAHPTWFRALENSDLKLRKVPLKEKAPTLSRAQRAIRNHIYDDVEKYGEAELKAAIEAVFGYAPGALTPAVIIPRPVESGEPETLSAAGV